MRYNPDQLHNVTILHYFDYCQTMGLEPTLAIYCGKTLMITSYKANDFLGEINQLFLKVQTYLFTFFKMLDNDPSKIEKMKREVTLFHFKQCEHLPEMKKNMKDAYLRKQTLEAFHMVFDENTNRLIFENETKKEV